MEGCVADFVQEDIARAFLAIDEFDQPRSILDDLTSQASVTESIEEERPMRAR
jgi:hypothetical protein